MYVHRPGGYPQRTKSDLTWVGQNACFVLKRVLFCVLLYKKSLLKAAKTLKQNVTNFLKTSVLAYPGSHTGSTLYRWEPNRLTLG